MAHFEKIDRVTVSFDKQDIRTYSISAGSYSATVTMVTADAKTVDLKFDNTTDLKQFIEMLITAGLKLEWETTYPSWYSNHSDGFFTLDDVREWKRVHDGDL
jgi:hypothetical protein